MCIPAAAMGAISAITAVAGTGLQIAGQMQASKAEAAASKYQADQSRILAA